MQNYATASLKRHHKKQTAIYCGLTEKMLNLRGFYNGSPRPQLRISRVKPSMGI